MTTRENNLRDHINNIFYDLRDHISNFGDFEKLLAEVEGGFFELSPLNGGPGPVDIIKRIVMRHMLSSLKDFRDFDSLGTEVRLLDTGKAGKQPSADIIGIQCEMGFFVIPEVKQDRVAERQGATELAAYSQGLQDRFWGMSAIDQVWIPISTEWRKTVRAAFVNEILWAARRVVPLHCAVTFAADDSVTACNISLVSLIEDVDEPTALSQFNWQCFDSLVISFPKAIPDHQGLTGFLSATAARLGLSGFVLYSDDPQSKYNYPFQIVMGVHNPFLGCLKRRQLQKVLEDDRIQVSDQRRAMLHQVGKGFWGWHDMDLLSGRDVEAGVLEELAVRAEDEGRDDEARNYRQQLDEYESLESMARASSNRINRLYEELKPRLKLFSPEFELSTPHMATLLLQKRSDYRFTHAACFGLFQEAMHERLLYEGELLKGNAAAIMAVSKLAPWVMSSNPETLFEFMDLMNFAHATQRDLKGDDPCKKN
jgi:hypothetical protein